jgi:hypothetical protein
MNISLLPRALFRWALLQQHKKTEAYEQINFVQWLDEQGMPYTAIPSKSIKSKLINKAMGLRRGFLDMVVVIPNKKVLFIEMKRIKGSTTSKEQKEWVKLLNGVNPDSAVVCKGFEEAKEYVKLHMNS